MQFWCSALDKPWAWVWKPYVGVWILCVGLLATYGWAIHRRRRRMPREAGATKRTVAFVGGVAAIWLASDWPVGLLGSSYLASVHMAQYMLYTLAAAPLLILGVPEWMARRLLGRLRLYRVARFVARPVVAAILFNVILVATNAPFAVDGLRASQIGSFALDMAWLGSGLILWLPICSSIPEISGRSYPVKMVYLFLAAGVLPMVPGGFLTFADHPLYETYELAPRVHGFRALADQQLAGAFMKVGNIPVVWTVIAVMFVRWSRQERAVEVEANHHRTTGSQSFAAPGTGTRPLGGGGYARPARRPTAGGPPGRVAEPGSS